MLWSLLSRFRETYKDVFFRSTESIVEKGAFPCSLFYMTVFIRRVIENTAKIT